MSKKYTKYLIVGDHPYISIEVIVLKILLSFLE
jgi:hypothetical protein